MSAVRTALATSLGIIFFLCLQTAVFAQDNASGQLDETTSQSSSLNILGVNTSRFPTVELSVSAGAGTPIIGQRSVAVRENEKTEPTLLTAGELNNSAGIHLAIAIDPVDLMAKGKTGLPLFAEAANSVLSMVISGTFPVAEDRTAIYSLASDGTLTRITDWNIPAQNANELIASATAAMASPDGEANTRDSAVTELLTQVLDQFPGANGFPSPRRTILLFSAGTTTPGVEEIEAKAEANGVNIDVIQLPVEGRENRPNPALELLATATGGDYLLLDEGRETALEAFGQSLQSGRLQQVFSYVSKAPDLATIQISADFLGSVISDTVMISPSIQAQPLSIAIVEPGNEIRHIELPDQLWEMGAVVPGEVMSVTTALTWPDLYTRTIEVITYTLSGPDGLERTNVVTTEPFTNTAFPLPFSPAGDYEVTVQAMDALGLESEKVSQPATIAFLRRQPPTPTPEPLLTATPLPTQPPPVVEASAVAAGANATESIDTDNPDEPLTLRDLLWLTMPVLVVLLGAYLVYPKLRSLMGRQAQSPQNKRQSKADSTAEPISPPVGGAPSASTGAVAESAAQGENRAQDNPKAFTPETPKVEGNPAGSEGDKAAASRSTPDSTSGGSTPTIRSEYMNLSSFGVLIRKDDDPKLPDMLEIKDVDQQFIGRNERGYTQNDIAINDQRISRAQARFTKRNGQLFIADRGSAAGTTVNGRRLEKEKEHLLHSGDTIHFGPVAYIFRAREDGAPTIFSSVPTDPT